MNPPTDRESQSSIEVLLRSIFPNGTDGTRATEIGECPLWPPDLFACTALLLERSGAYTHPAFFYMDKSFASKDKLALWRELGVEYASLSKSLNHTMSEYWNSIIAASQEALVDRKVVAYADPPNWVLNAFILMHISDIACAGVGVGYNDPCLADSPCEEIRISQRRDFAREHTERLNRISHIATMERDYQQTRNDLKSLLRVKAPLPYLPYSICKVVPPHIACVQPKAMTPQLGHTIRSFSHNLALLPPHGEVVSQWFNLQTVQGHRRPTVPDDDTHGLNVLLIPYPYRIDGQCFTPTDRKGGKNTFQVQPLWLYDLARHERGQVHHLISGIESLVSRAQREVGKIDVIVFPELSMPHTVAEEVSSHFFKDSGSSVRLFLAGVSSERCELEEDDGGERESARRRMNAVYIRASWRGFPITSESGETRYLSIRRLQVKHHRWQMDERQISRYNLSSKLDINRTVLSPSDLESLGPQFIAKPVWWEDADVIERECLFWVVKNDYVLSAVICEDLARIDPVQQVLRSVGPNLLFVLLMDGPQLGARWSSRYATCLGDDPGTSVVTLTSLGMVKRSFDGTETKQIGLWRDAFSDTKELELPSGCGAVVLGLVEHEIPERTASLMDQKSKPEVSRKLRLGSVIPIEAPPGSEKKMFRFL